MKKFLKLLKIVQEIDNSNREKKMGRGFSKAYRLNPYNPLSYLTIILALIIGLLMFGFVGIRKEMDFSNPFKWN